jgi:RNA polymerase sigma-70 factor (ECF subfamily)
LEDRLQFRRAQGILAGLIGCGQAATAESLRTTAAQLDISVSALAKQVLSSVDTPRDPPAEALLLRIAGTALMPYSEAHPRPVGTLHVTRSAGRASLTGELDGVTASVLPEHSALRPLERLGTALSGRTFRLDLTGLTFLNAAGLRALEGFRSRIRDGGMEVSVVPPVESGPRSMLQFAVDMGYLSPGFLAERPSLPWHRNATARPDRRTPTGGPSAGLDDLEALYDSYAAACWSFARRLLDDDANAEAVVVATFVEARRHLQAGRALPERVGTWLLLLTHRNAVQLLRELRTGRIQDADRPAGPASRPSQVDDAFAALPSEQGQGLQLAFWGGLTVSDIAASTGVPLADARASLLAGMRSLSGGVPDGRSSRDGV